MSKRDKERNRKREEGERRERGKKPPGCEEPRALPSGYHISEHTGVETQPVEAEALPD